MSETTAKTHAMRAQLELRKKILTGALSGGTRLFEVALAEELEISRTPLRDAMSRLAEEGLLDRAPNGGFAVRKFTFADVIDAIELRGVLEGTSARLAAERGISQEAREKMEGILSRLDGCFEANSRQLDFESYAANNLLFHDALARLSGSEIVLRAINQFKNLPFASPSAFSPANEEAAAFRSSLHVGQDQHRAIVSAIVAREGTRAEALAREHARVARRNLEYIMVEDPSLIVQVPELALIAEQ